jgi:hypothetical protein
VYLNFINRQAKREAGRLVERLPVSGKLTWMIYPKQSFGLLKVAMRHRLIQAAGKMVLEEDTHGLFGNQAGIQQADQAPIKAQAMPYKAHQASDKGTKAVSAGIRKASGKQAKALPARNQADVDEIVYAEGIVNLPAWLPDEPTMSISKIVDKCVDNNETDIGTVINYASRIKRTPVNYSTVQKAMFRSRSRAEGLM